MTPRISESQSRQAWELTRRQHGVLTRRDLVALGFSAEAIKHRVRQGRLHPVVRGVYAVGRPDLSREGRWMAAVLACGPGAALSHRTPAAQTRDALRFQAHTAAGRTPLRFSHRQVRYEPRHVLNNLRRTAAHLRADPDPYSPGEGAGRARPGRRGVRLSEIRGLLPPKFGVVVDATRGCRGRGGRGRWTHLASGCNFVTCLPRLQTGSATSR